jgi:hypothetical protein
MESTTRSRWTTLVGIGIGVIPICYGGALLLQKAEDLPNVALWFVGAIVLHDLVWMPLVLLAWWLGAKLVPAKSQPVAVVCAVTLGLFSIVGLPFLLGIGRRLDNPTLLDRPYWLAWVSAAFLALGVFGLHRGWLWRRSKEA